MKKVFEGWRARDFDALIELTHPEIVALVAAPPADTKRAYKGKDEVLAFLWEGEETYAEYLAEATTFAVGPTGRVLAEGWVSYKRREDGGLASVAYWVCEVRDERIVYWESFSDADRARHAAGMKAPPPSEHVSRGPLAPPAPAPEST